MSAFILRLQQLAFGYFSDLLQPFMAFQFLFSLGSSALTASVSMLRFQVVSRRLQRATLTLEPRHGTGFKCGGMLSTAI